jgi:hypothetical protein
MLFYEKDFEIPEVCVALGFEDRSDYHEQSARMYNPELDLTLFVNEPNSGKKRYVLQELNDWPGAGLLPDPVDMVDTDDELRELVAKVRRRVYSEVTSHRGFCVK